MRYLPPSKASKKIVVDANLVAATVTPILGLEKAEVVFIRLMQEGCNLYAPEWWLAEVISVLRQQVYRRLISPESAHDAVEDVFSLNVEMVPLDVPLCQRALDWAEVIHHSKIYDSIYLALAERLHADFWTADKKLAEAARAAGAKWVNWAGDS